MVSDFKELPSAVSRAESSPAGPGRLYYIIFLYYLIFLSEQVLAAASSLQPETPEKFQKEYLSSKAKTLIKQIDNTPSQETDSIQKLRKAVRKQVRKDKRQHLCDQLLQDSKGPPSKQWATLKFVRKPYTPKTQGVLQPNGKIYTKLQSAKSGNPGEILG